MSGTGGREENRPKRCFFLVGNATTTKFCKFNFYCREFFLVDVSDIFYFFCLGQGKGESEGPGGVGGDFSCKIPEGGGSPRRVGGGEGPGGC